MAPKKNSPIELTSNKKLFCKNENGFIITDSQLEVFVSSTVDMALRRDSLHQNTSICGKVVSGSSSVFAFCLAPLLTTTEFKYFLGIPPQVVRYLLVVFCVLSTIAMGVALFIRWRITAKAPSPMSRDDIIKARIDEAQVMFKDKAKITVPGIPFN